MKTGIILEGGASRTYFSVGVLDALADEHISFDVLVGSSAGIANGTSFVSEQRGRNIDIGLHFLSDKRYMGLWHLLNRKNKSYYNIDFVFNELPNRLLPFDYSAFRASRTAAYASVTNLKTGQAEHILLDGLDPSWRVLVASCAMPALFPPVALGHSLYMDGGIADPIPSDFAFQLGCDRLLVLLTRERSYRKLHERGASLFARKMKAYPAFGKLLLHRCDLYNNAREKLFALEKQGRVMLFAPSDTKTWHRTESNPAKIKAMYDEGFHLAQESMPAIKQFLGLLS